MTTVFSKASLPMEMGVGCIYSQSRGRGHGKFFPDPQFLRYFLATPQFKMCSAVLDAMLLLGRYQGYPPMGILKIKVFIVQLRLI